MEISFESNRLQKEFENEKKLLKKQGAKRANLIKQRIAEIHAATSLEDLRNLPGPRLHQHSRMTGHKAVFSVDLDHPYRLLFEANHDPEPELPGGGVDWIKVTKILIKEITDPHG